MKPTVLFIMHMPPPVHGAAVVGGYIRDSKLVAERYDCRFINLALANDMSDIGRGSLRKAVRFLSLLRQVWNVMRRAHPSLVYITPNSAGAAFYKDFVVVELVKAMGGRVVLHFHNKGVRMRQDRRIDNMLYRLFFHKAKVILLADCLYDDIRRYVAYDDVYVCPNGIPD